LPTGGLIPEAAHLKLSKMVKKASQRKSKKGQRKASRNPAITRMWQGLDEAGAQYARLLSDPCNAQMVAPTYGGMGTGNYRRMRVQLNLLTGSNVDLQLVINPSQNFYWFGQTLAGATGVVGTAQPMFGGPLAGATADFRVLAACAKVRYIGAESARAGLVGLAVCPPMFEPAAAGVGSAAYIVNCPMVSRTGETQHEVKWVPSAGDEAFDSRQNRINQGCSALHVVTQGTPTGTIVIDITAVMELGPDTQSTFQNAATVVVPPSRFTTNHVLQALGPVSRWAYNNVLTPVIKAGMSGAYSAAFQSTQAAVSGASRMLMLT